MIASASPLLLLLLLLLPVTIDAACPGDGTCGGAGRGTCISSSVCGCVLPAAGYECHYDMTTVSVNTPLPDQARRSSAASWPVLIGSMQYVAPAGSAGALAYYLLRDGYPQLSLRTSPRGGYCYSVDVYWKYRCNESPTSTTDVDPKWTGSTVTPYSYYDTMTDSCLAHTVTPSSSRDQYGCSTGDGYTDEIHSILVINKGTQGCNFTLALSDTAYSSACYGRGTWDSTASVCDCSTGAGRYCLEDPVTLVVGTPLTGLFPVNVREYYTYTFPASGTYGDLKFSFTRLSGECASSVASYYATYMAVQYNCGGCTHKWPKEYCGSSAFVSGSYDKKTVNSYGDQNAVITYAESDVLDNCGCSGSRHGVVFRVAVVFYYASTTYPAPECQRQFEVTLLPVCSGHGTKIGSDCVCDNGWTGSSCDLVVTRLALGEAHPVTLTGTASQAVFMMNETGIADKTVHFSASIPSCSSITLMARYYCPGSGNTCGNPPLPAASLSDTDSYTSSSSAVDLYFPPTRFTNCGCNGVGDGLHWAIMLSYSGSGSCTFNLTSEADDAFRMSAPAGGDTVSGVVPGSSATGVAFDHTKFGRILCPAPFDDGTMTITVAQTDGSTAEIELYLEQDGDNLEFGDDSIPASFSYYWDKRVLTGQSEFAMTMTITKALWATAGEWVIVGLRNMGTANHGFTITARSESVCPSSRAGVCSNNGTCQLSGTCVCTGMTYSADCSKVRSFEAAYNQVGVDGDRCVGDDAVASGTSTCSLTDGAFRDVYYTLSDTNTLFNYTVTSFARTTTYAGWMWVYHRKGEMPLVPNEGTPTADGVLVFPASGVTMTQSFVLTDDAITGGRLYFLLTANGTTSYAYAVAFDDDSGTVLDVIAIALLVVLVVGCCIYIKRKPEKIKTVIERLKSKQQGGDKWFAEALARDFGRSPASVAPQKPSARAGRAAAREAAKAGGNAAAGSADPEEEAAPDEAAEMEDSAAPAARPPLQGTLIERLKAVDRSTWSLYAIMVLLRGVQILLQIIKIVFNVSLIHSSLVTISSVAPWPDIDIQLTLTLPGIGSIGHLFSGMFDALDFLPKTVQNWNCGGSVTFVAVLAVFVTVAFAFVILQMDLLLVLGIRMKRLKKGRGRIAKKIIDTATGLSVTLALYFLQSLLTFSMRIIAAVLTAKGTCSDLDHGIVWISQTYMVFVFLAMGAVMLKVFAGRLPTAVYGNVLAFLGVVLLNLVSLTVGFWPDVMVASYDVINRAETFDDDPDDDDNQHQTVLSILGRSRGVFWMAIPGTVILAKAAEMLNDPPALTRSPRLECSDPRGVRLFKYLKNLLNLCLMIDIVYSASRTSLIVIIITFAPELLLDLYRDFDALQRGMLAGAAAVAAQGGDNA